MKDILHITRDAAFIDTAYRIFEEAAPGRSDFILFSKEAKLKYIKSTPIKKYNHYVIYNKYKLKKICSGYRIFIFHALTSNELYILRSLPEDSKIVWLGWGYDYYDLIEKDFLKPLTRSIQHVASETPFQRLKSSIARTLFAPPSKISLINRVDYFSPVLYEDYLLVQKSLSNFRPQYVSWNCGTLEDDLIRGFEGLVVDGKNILLGNSASITNNHMDAFDLLRTMDLKDRRIFTPLSYGDASYRDLIIERGKAMFGRHFVPVVDFMPIDDYLKMISTCSVAVMNHLRQEGVGNIVIMLYLGAKIFFDRDNPVYTFLKNQGALVFTMDELGSEIDNQLEPDQIELNRSILRKTWSREVIVQKTKEMIWLVEKQSFSQYR